MLFDFENNKKYISKPFYKNEYIDKNEHVSYEMSINNKVYVACFHQIQSKEEVEKLETEIFENYESVSSYLKSIFGESSEAMKTFSFLDDENLSKKEKADAVAALFGGDLTSNSVWFTIAERYGEFYILLYYDNENNRPNGEDL